MSSIKKVAVIGTGVIGTGWIIRCLAHNKIIYAFDKDLKLKNSLIKEIKRTWPFVKKLFKKNKLNLKNFYYLSHLIYFQIINLKLLKSNEKISHNIFNTCHDDYPIDNIWKCN